MYPKSLIGSVNIQFLRIKLKRENGSFTSDDHTSTSIVTHDFHFLLTMIESLT